MPDTDPDNSKRDDQGTALDPLIDRFGWKRIGLAFLILCVVIVPPVVWLATKGSGSEPAAGGSIDAARATAAGCTVHTFAHGVTDDPKAGRAYEQEALFGNHPPLPRGGWQEGGKPPALVNVLHTLSHEWLVVKYNPALPTVQKQELHTWTDGAGRGVAVIPGNAGLGSAFAAIKWGHGLNCVDVTPAAISVLTEFEREVKATLPGA